jgi:hypothetical protein
LKESFAHLTHLEQVKQGLPSLEIDEMNSGNYYINLHIVTGRKPAQPRAGDLLLDGTRQGMIEPRYNGTTSAIEKISNSWTR